MKFRFLVGKHSHIPGIKAGRLAPCPTRPNCVCSDASDSLHGISALKLTTPPDRAWEAARSAVLSLPRTKIVSESDGYLHAECRSAVLGFVDDLELHLQPQSDSIAVRSASRLGYSDFGVNRKRVESLRAALAAEGV